VDGFEDLYYFINWETISIVDTRVKKYHQWIIPEIKKTELTNNLGLYAATLYSIPSDTLKRTKMRLVYDQKDSNNRWVLDKLYILRDAPNLIDRYQKNQKP
jgi:hypothetical protein